MLILFAKRKYHYIQIQNVVPFASDHNSRLVNYDIIMFFKRNLDYYFIQLIYSNKCNDFFSSFFLITQATFDDSMPVEAIMKNHSTTKEAIEVAKSAGVYRVILTHFSQRYPKIPILSDNYTSHVCIAFDMMSVNLVDLPLIPRLLPAFKTLFRDEMLLDDDIEMVA